MNDSNLQTLTSDDLDRLRGAYDVIPIFAVLSADTITPVSAFASLDDGGEGFLLESVERGENAGRYSYVALTPRKRLTVRAGERPLAALRDELRPLRVFGEAALPPFTGGAVGFLGYGAAQWSERLPDSQRSSFESIPDASLLFFDRVLAFDHLRQTLFVVQNVLARDSRSSQELLDAARRSIAATIERLSTAAPDLASFDVEAPVAFENACSQESFASMVEQAKNAIAAGEIFQAVLSQRWVAPYPTREALTLYRALRSVNPSPYMFLLRTAESTLVGASPEMLVRVRGSRVETRPIAGTRPRGASPEEDAAREQTLLLDEKERAEHLMLVDLGRNDLGRVCRAGSVEVDQFSEVERYSHVMHLVSNVRGQLRDDASALDALLAAFPAGTVSGAPKIRAMEIIDALEPLRRGVYAGAVACFSFGGALDSCIAIRTIVLHDGLAEIQAGAGIVADSDPAREYDETCQKSAALRRALTLALGRGSVERTSVRRVGTSVPTPSERGRDINRGSAADGDMTAQLADVPPQRQAPEAIA